jgi:hypothetical protein
MSRVISRFTLAAVMGLVLPLAANAGTLALDITGNPSTSTTGDDYTAGWSFTTGSSAIDVTALDGLTLSGTGNQVRLYGANQTTLVSATIVSGMVVGSGGDFYSVAVTPTLLAANTTYYIAEDLPLGTGFAYFATTVTTAAITYGTEISASGLGLNPTTDLYGGTFNDAFFGPSFEYTLAAPPPLGVPEIDPSSAASAFALLSMGVALLRSRRRKTA